MTKRPNAYRVERDHAVITVACKGVEMDCLVSLCDLKNVLRYRWRARWAAECNRFYVVTGNSRHMKSLHRFIMQPPKGMVVDHIHHDGLDNRRESLRVVTNQVNILNRRPKAGKSGYRGVVQRPNGKFRASIMVNRKRLVLGEFTEAKDAAQCVQQFLATVNGLQQAA